MSDPLFPLAGLMGPTAPPVTGDEVPPEGQGQPVPPQLGLPWTEEDTARWRARITASDLQTQPVIEEGKKNVRRYINRFLDQPPTSDTVAVPASFWLTEQKKALLFFRVPEVQLTPKNPESQQSVALAQQVLNDYLGPEHTHVKDVMNEILFDLICSVGFGAVKIGYDSYSTIVTDPLSQGQQSTPTTEEYYIRRISPGRLIKPVDFDGTDFDFCDYLGFHFEENVLPGDDGPGTSTSDRDDNRRLSDDEAQQRSRPVRTIRKGVEVWYRRRTVDKTVTDPNAFAFFVLMDGDTTPRRHEPSPCHLMGPTGWVGMKGFPIKVLRTKYVSDSSDAPSDVQITRVLNDELSRGRTQLLTSRDRKMPTIVYDSGRDGVDTLLDKIRRNESHGFVGLPGDPRSIFHVLDKGAVAPENYTFNDIAEGDLRKAWALGANQQGVQTETTRTATELTLIQNNSDTRLDFERDIVTDFFCNKICRNLLALIQLFADQQQYTRILGADGGQKFALWNRHNLRGEFSYNIKVNSQLRPDSAADLKRITDVVNFSAKSPYVNQIELWRAAMQAWGFDPDRVIREPDPPKSDPPQVNLSLTLKVEDFANPVTFPYARFLAQAAGLDVTQIPNPGPEQIAAALFQAQAEQQQAREGQPRPPGTAEEVDVMTKHKAEETGRLPGRGSTVADNATRGGFVQ